MSEWLILLEYTPFVYQPSPTVLYAKGTQEERMRSYLMGLVQCGGPVSEAEAEAATNASGGGHEDEWEEASAHFKEAWTKPPVIDKDRAAVNYLGHPYFGMNFYLSQRNYGESPLYSFLFATLTSTCFEYFIESWSERPSIQDLLITPIVGSILGELVFRATQEMRKDGLTTGEKVILTVINPLYVLQNGYR